MNFSEKEGKKLKAVGGGNAKRFLWLIRPRNTLLPYRNWKGKSVKKESTKTWKGKGRHC